MTTVANHAPPEAPVGVGSRGSRIVGAATLAAFGLLLFLGLVTTPPDEVQGESVRLLYLHAPVATVEYLAFFVTALGSALFLWKKSRFWDCMAAASAEIGVVFASLTLVTGMVWGKPTWGVYWTWDARLTSTALLLVLYLGYLAVRRIPGEPMVRAKRAAFAGLIAFLDVPIVHYATEWWRTLHQGPTLKRADPTIDGSMLFALFVGFVAFALLYWWLMLLRFRVQYLEDRLEEQGLDAALAERRAEGAADDAGSVGGAVDAPGAATVGSGS